MALHYRGVDYRVSNAMRFTAFILCALSLCASGLCADTSRLEIISMYTDPQDISAGGAFLVYFTVNNSGSIDFEGGITTSLSADGKDVDADYVHSEIPINGTRKFYFSNAPPFTSPGAHELRVEIEYDGGSHYRRGTFQVSSASVQEGPVPKLEVGGVSISPDPAKASQLFEVTFTVKNTGHAVFNGLLEADIQMNSTSKKGRGFSADIPVGGEESFTVGGISAGIAGQYEMILKISYAAGEGTSESSYKRAISITSTTPPTPQPIPPVLPPVAQKPILSVESVSTDPENLTTGEDFDLRFEVRNSGNADLEGYLIATLYIDAAAVSQKNLETPIPAGRRRMYSFEGVAVGSGAHAGRISVEHENGTVSKDFALEAIGDATQQGETGEAPVNGTAETVPSGLKELLFIIGIALAALYLAIVKKDAILGALGISRKEVPVKESELDRLLRERKEMAGIIKGARFRYFKRLIDEETYKRIMTDSTEKMILAENKLKKLLKSEYVDKMKAEYGDGKGAKGVSGSGKKK